MQRWTGRVALVTGASAGIGAAIAKDLVRQGMKVVAGARRVEKVEVLNADLTGASGKLYPRQLDVTKEENILETFNWIQKNLGGVDVLINNAGIYKHTNGSDNKTQDIRDILDTNVVGLSICTREAIKSMKSRGIDDGHIIHINSVIGHTVINFPGIGTYAASKHAVTALTEALRQELVRDKSRIRISSISPGAVETDFLLAAGLPADEVQGIYENTPSLKSEDVSNAVLYVLGTPAHVQVHDIILRPTGDNY